MTIRILYRLGWFGFVALILASVLSASAAANSVPSTRLTDQRHAITPNALKPPECAALNLTSLYVCTSNPCFGTSGAVGELILGTAGAETIYGGRGHDCILGGGGDDEIYGQQGNDVLIGGPGTDTCYGGPGTDTCYSEITIGCE